MKHTAFLILIILWSIRGFSQIPPYGDYAVKVDVVGNGFAHNTLIYFEDDGWDPPATIPTYGWDGCCDAQMLLGNANQPHIYTEVVAPPLPPGNPPANTRLSINGLPHLFEQTDVLMGFLPGTLAQYELKFTYLSTLPQGVVVELEDVIQNVSQDLLLDSVYTTWGAVSDDPARFIIHFYPSDITSLNQTDAKNKVNVISGLETIFIEGLASIKAAELSIVDMEGRIVWSEDVGEGVDVTTINKGFCSEGVYLLRVRRQDGNIETHKINI